jgi:hypothetical protein
VVNRSKTAVDACIEHLTSFLMKFCELTRRERIALRNRAERMTERFTWDVMAAHYHRAHAEARSLLSPAAGVTETRLRSAGNQAVNSDTI